MATLDSHDVYLAVIRQFGYNLATFWVTYTGADSLMVFMCLGDLLKIALGPFGLATFLTIVSKLFTLTNWEKLACFEYNRIRMQPQNRNG